MTRDHKYHMSRGHLPEVLSTYALYEIVHTEYTVGVFESSAWHLDSVLQEEVRHSLLFPLAACPVGVLLARQMALEHPLAHPPRA
jgi:hypothetical protein